jgi:hypothetical protein
MSDEKSMEIMPPASAYPLETRAIDQVLALIDENLAGRPLNVLEFPKIKLLGGGALNFRLEGAGDDETPKTIEGIMVAYRAARIYWKRPYGGKGGSKKPPDCTSTDGFVGIGDPGGECAQCPFAKFGSAVNALDGRPTNGQACKDVRQALVLLPGHILPYLLNVPPTSVKNFNQYTLTMLSTGTRYWAAVTRFSLERASNEDGVDYAKILFRLEHRLSIEEQRALQPYQERMKEILTPSIVDASAYEIIDNEKNGGAPTDSDVPF